jgi:hypothetical protein
MILDVNYFWLKMGKSSRVYSHTQGSVPMCVLHIDRYTMGIALTASTQRWVMHRPRVWSL